MREVEVAMSRGPDESGGFDGTEDPYDALLDPDEEADNEEVADYLDAIDQGDPATDEPNLYDTSWVPPDRPPGHGDFGTTLAEEREGESLDQRLAEEEPDVGVAAAAEDDAEVATEREAEDPALRGSLVARDVGIAGAGASAEEAAVHVVDEDEEE